MSLGVSGGEASALGAILIMLSVPVMVFLGIAFLRGLYRNCVDLFGMHGLIQNWYFSRRPVSRHEHTLSAIIADMVTDPDSWAIVKTKELWSHRYDAVKGSIRIKRIDYPRWGYEEWEGYTGPEVEIAGMESFTMNNVRPSLVKQLWQTADNLRGHRANMAILDTIMPSCREGYDRVCGYECAYPNCAANSLHLSNPTNAEKEVA